MILMPRLDILRSISSEPKNELETNVEDCESSSFGCCSDSHLPAHGPNQEGCCLQSEFGCCPDNIRPANGPNVEGCGCETSEHGCCPDGKTVQRGGNLEGCGCAVSEFGCCQVKNLYSKFYQKYQNLSN